MTDLFRTAIAVPPTVDFTAARRDLEPGLADVLVAVEAWNAGAMEGLREGRRRAQAELREVTGL